MEFLKYSRLQLALFANSFAFMLWFIYLRIQLSEETDCELYELSLIQSSTCSWCQFSKRFSTCWISSLFLLSICKWFILPYLFYSSSAMSNQMQDLFAFKWVSGIEYWYSHKWTCIVIPRCQIRGCRAIKSFRKSKYWNVDYWGSSLKLVKINLMCV